MIIINILNIKSKQMVSEEGLFNFYSMFSKDLDILVFKSLWPWAPSNWEDVSLDLILEISARNKIDNNCLSANPTKWSNTLSVFDHFVGLAVKGIT